MKEPIGAAVSNSFRIVDGDVFLEHLRAYYPTIQIESSSDEIGDSELMPGQTRVQLHATDGYWPSDDNADETVRSDLFETVADHVAPGELAIFHSISMQGPNDIRIQSTSVSEHGACRLIEIPQLEALHRVAQSMGA